MQNARSEPLFPKLCTQKEDLHPSPPLCGVQHARSPRGASRISGLSFQYFRRVRGGLSYRERRSPYSSTLNVYSNLLLQQTQLSYKSTAQIVVVYMYTLYQNLRGGVRSQRYGNCFPYIQGWKENPGNHYIFPACERKTCSMWLQFSASSLLFGQCSVHIAYYRQQIQLLLCSRLSPMDILLDLVTITSFLW